MSNPDFTVGVEEEYQLVQPSTGALKSCARLVLAADWSGELKKEIQESTIEIGTRVCSNATDAGDELRRLRFHAATAAAATELAIVAAGVHPFSRWETHEMTEDERYARMANEYGRIAKDEHNFGMHIHVAVPAELDRVPLLNAVRCYVPHLLALSCSSPFYEGADTGYASFRMILWRRWPSSGIPPRFSSDAEYRRYVATLLRAGTILDERNIYWTIRLHPEYPTLEFRMCDVCPRIEDAVPVAALTRTLVAAAANGMLPPRRSGGLSEPALDAILADDLWRVTRHGLDARLVDVNTGSGFMTARDAVRSLVHGLASVADDLGEADALSGVERILLRGNAADRMRALAPSRGLAGLVAWLQTETLLGTGLDSGGETIAREQAHVSGPVA